MDRVRLSTLFEEAGIDPTAEWFLAEGADAPTMHRSIPVRKAMDDAIIALYQNGEPLNPSNGYPVRLLLPGYEGNMNVKWLRRIKVVDGPIMAQNETMAYTILLPSGKAWQFFYPQEVKSFISHPSPGMSLKGPGFHEISGLSWSGNGRISKVEVSADGGESWASRSPADAGVEQGADPLPHAVELGRFARSPAQPRHRRGRQRAAEQPCRLPGRTRCQPRAYSRQLTCVPDGTLQRHLELGRERKGRGEQCLCLICTGIRRLRRHRDRASQRPCRAPPAAADAPHFGQPISPADAAAWDISVGPDGAGLPAGRRHAGPGRRYLSRRSAPRVMATRARAKPNARLVGGQITGGGPVVKTVGSYWPYATTLFDFVRRAMPWTATKSLTDDEVYAVSAYVLRMNNIVGDNDVMDAKTLPQIKMPNRDGFIPLYPAKH